MGVLIKGMKMPENCVACEFSFWSNIHQTAACKVNEDEACFDDFSKEYKARRSSSCPLIEVPEEERMDCTKRA